MNIFKKFVNFYHTRKLFKAISDGASLAVIDDLIKKGVNLSATIKKGKTPLHLAAINCGPAVIQRLIDAGADVGARDARGCRPLIYAIKHHKIKNIEPFYKTGLREIDALDEAVETGNVNTVKAVLNYGGYCKNKELARAVDGTYVQHVEMLLAAGADPETIPKKIIQKRKEELDHCNTQIISGFVARDDNDYPRYGGAAGATKPVSGGRGSSNPEELKEVQKLIDEYTKKQVN